MSTLTSRVRDAALDDLLSRFHRWMQAYTGTRGFGAKSLVCGDFRTSRQYDDANGALDDHIETDVMKAVDFQVGEMVEPYRSAIYCNARALAVGVTVFTSPRLPADPLERAVVVADAREMITNRLLSAGVM